MKPGSEGTTTSKASAGSPPWAAGSARGPITSWKSQKVQGPAVGEHQGQGRGAHAAGVQEVDGMVVHHGPEVGPGLHGGFLLAPVEVLAPVAHQLPEVVRVHPVAPVVVLDVDGPADVAQASHQIVDALLGKLDPEGLDAHGDSSRAADSTPTEAREGGTLAGMHYDTLIRGGSLVDGTGAPAFAGDVALKDGRIAALGEVAGDADHVIDATGRVVSPGFVDIHTHYDAQVFWDGALSPSPFHGVTTIVGGNCGFSIAPLAPHAGEYLMRMLARVEGMPIESLREGVPWDWTGFGEYLSRLEGRLAVNAGFMVGHSALRRVVMGERAVGEEATPEEVEAMCALLRESLAAGGLGFSSTRSAAHNDAEGNPVPSRHASVEELFALCRVNGEHPGTSLEMLPGTSVFTEEDLEILTGMSLASNRALNWNLVAPSSEAPEVTENQLAASDYAAARGARVLALTVPQEIQGRINLLSGFGFDALPGWLPIMGLPVPARKQALADPAVREELRRGAERQGAGLFKAMTNWSAMRINEVFEDRNKPLEGRTLGDVAKERGGDPFDLLFDLSLDEGLRTSFMPQTAGQTDDESWAMRGRAWKDPRTIIGASDAGAHLDTIDTFAFTTQLLGRGVREKQLIGLEEAVHQITDVPARLYGMTGRGRLAPGWHADLVVFDPARIAKGPTYTRFDLPAGAGRLYADAEGIDHVIVGGHEIVRGTELTGARPGHVLRSGRDTETVAL